MRPGDCLRTAFFYHLSRLAGRGAFPASPGGDPAGQLPRAVVREGSEAVHGQGIGKKERGDCARSKNTSRASESLIIRRGFKGAPTL